MKNPYLGLLLLFSFALLFNGCDSGSDNVAVTPELEATLKDGNKFNYQGREYFLRITTTGSWKIEKPASDDWYSFSFTSGEGSQTVVLKIEENDGEPRRSTIRVVSGERSKVIEIIQDKFNEEEAYFPSKEAHRIEVPRLSEDYIDGKAKFVYHYAPVTNKGGENILNFSLEYNINARHSRWIAFTFYDKTAKSPEGRSNAWAPDPKLAEWTSNESDYLGSGYDRGHLMASADRLYSRVANEQTFYYSNITPQNRDLNSGIWLELENILRNYWGRSNTFRDTLYVVKGATIRDDQITGTIGKSQIVVPKYNYMAVLSKKADTYKSIAFWFKNSAYPKPYNLKSHIVSVAELEELTGIDFFHNLPDEIESVVEKQKRISDWPGL